MAARPAGNLGTLYGPQIDASSILYAVFSGAGIIWISLLAILYVYSVADAAIRASKTMTSDSTGLV